MKVKIVVGNFFKNRVTAALFKYAVPMLSVILSFAIQTNAQMVQRVNGTDCVGANNVFVLTGASSCSSVYWSVSGSNYTIITQSSSSITVKWNIPTSNAFVTANYSSCPFYPYSGSAYSSSINITNPLTPSVSITASQNGVCLNTSVTFTAAPTNGGAAAYYNWKVNGSAAPGATNVSTYTTTSLTHGQVVSCVMTSSLTCLTTSTATSNSITMAITTPGAVSVSINSAPLPFCGGVGGFTAAVVNGGASPVYTWYKNNVLATDNQSGQPANVYAPSAPLGDGVVVKCVVTSNQSCITNNPATSNQITVTVTTPTNPMVSISPSSSTICAGSNITFTATSPQTGYSLASFSWTLNGIAVGTNSSTYTSNQISSSSIIGLTATFSGTCLTTTSKTASLTGITVNPLPTAVISPVGNVKICSTCTQLITATPSGTGYSYVWKKDGAVIPGATLSINSTATAGTYLSEVTYNGCTTASSALLLTKNVAPTSNGGVDKVLTLPLNTVTLNGSGSDNDGSIASYQWSKISGVFGSTSGEATPTLVLSNLSGGSHIYRLAVTDDFGETRTDDVSIVVNPPSSNDYNRIQTVTVMVPTKTSENQLATLSIGQKQEVNQYFDGLGRVMQTVTTKASQGSLDIVQPVVYDAYEREPKKYLPFTAGNNGNYQPSQNIIDAAGNYAGAAQLFYSNGSNNNIADDTRPYSETTYETSPLNRPMKEYGPGQNWRDNSKFIEYKYLNNIHGTAVGQEKIISWTINASGMPIRKSTLTNFVEAGGYYSSNQLQVYVTTDEQLNAVREYKNKSGELVLKKVQTVSGSTNLNSSTDWALTYYIYDAFGNLRYVFQPELSKNLHSGVDTYTVTASDLNNFAFQYKYDTRNRMSEKRVPGSDWVYMVYDKRDRIILTQDGNQRTDASGNVTKKDWTYTKYDALNRPIMTGIYTHVAAVLNQVGMQSYLNTQMSTGNQFYEDYNADGTYTARAFPTTSTNLLTITYYDNYNFLPLWVQTNTYTYVYDSLIQTVNGAPYSHPSTANPRVTGQVTGSRIRVLDGGGTGGYTWLKSVNYYDDKYRLVQSLSDNYKGGIDRISNLFDFAGKVLNTKTTHTEADVTWKDIIGVKPEGNKLIKTAPAGWGNSGAASAQQLLGGQIGWLEFVASESNQQRAIGLSSSNADANHTTIGFAWVLKSDGTLQIQEGLNNRGTFGTYLPGDVFKIERTSTSAIKYYQNNVWKFTSPSSSTSILMVDAALDGNAATLTNVRTSFSTTQKRIYRRFEYDHNHRLTQTWHKVDKGTEFLLALNTYNELSQLIDKKLHSTIPTGTDAKQSVDYEYNVRGWLTKINKSDVSTIASGDAVKDYFGMELGYNASIGTGNGGTFNGNISGIKWSTNQGHGTVKELGYNFTYDAMNRLTSAISRQKNSSWESGKFDERGIVYDLNGNIQALKRKDGGTHIDSLVYNYGAGATASNRLHFVQDVTTISVNKAKGFVDGNTGTNTDYTYDFNGNMTRDLNKGIGNSLSDVNNLIAYNYLNLPEVVTKGGNSVRYIYDATGRKIAQVVTAATMQKQTDYAGEFVYENDALQFVNHEEGRITVGSTKLLIKDGCESVSTTTATSATLAPYTNATTGEKYITATSNGVARSGISAIGGPMYVQPGERYRIRAKGYSLTNPVYISIKANETDLSWPGASLPIGAVAESWVEQTVTIPAGDTILKAGATWNMTVGNPETFYLNEFEVMQLTSSTPEYQYHLKDHLGNVRLTFTTAETTDQSVATMETANANLERSQYLYYNEAVKINSTLFDHTTNASSGGTVAVTAVQVSPSTLSLAAGQTGQLTNVIVPANASNQAVTWTTSNASVATVNSTGAVTGVAAGTATITVTSTANGSATATSTVTVGGASSGLSPLIALKFNENTGTTTANTGSLSSTFTRSTTVPAWSINVPATVGGASSLDFGTTTGNYAVESGAVIDGLKNLTSFTLTGWLNCRNSTEGGGGNRIISWINNGGDGVDLVYKGDGSIQLSVDEFPDGSPAISSSGKITTNASAPAGNWVFFAVTYQSSNGQVQFYFGSNATDATFDVSRAYNEGAVGSNIARLAIGHFNSATRSTATDRMFRGLIDDIQIHGSALTLSQIVSAQRNSSGGGGTIAVTGVSVAPSAPVLTLGSVTTVQLASVITPANATNPSVTWASSNTGVATVNSSGLVTAVAAGTTTITATSVSNGSVSGTSTVTVNAASGAVTGVSVAPSAPVLTLGSVTTVQLASVMTPSNATNPSVTWASSNTGVATVNSSGLVTAVAAGSTTITATSVSNGSVSGTSTVTVNAASSGLSPLIALKFNENTGTTTANTGSLSSTFARSTTVPAWSTNVPATVGGASSLDFGSTTGDYAVESGAVIDGLKNLASFTLTGWLNCRNSTEGGGGNRILSWINNGGDGVDLVYKGDGSLQLSVDEFPDGSPAISSSGKITTNASAPAGNWVFFAVTYQSSNGQVQFYFGSNATDATFDVSRAYNEGAVGSNIARLAIGHFNSATRSAATDRMFRGLIDDIQIHGSALTLSQIVSAQRNSSGGTVTVTGLSVAPVAPVLKLGSVTTVQLASVISPANATNPSVTWASSNTGVATVNASGLVTAVAAGTATITATSVSNGSVSGTSTVTVNAASSAVTGVSVAPSAPILTLASVTTVQLASVITPSNATNPSVTWASSNTGVATVNASGFVTAVAAGTTTITATSVSNGSISGTSTVTVNAAGGGGGGGGTAVTGITLAPSTLTLTSGQTGQLTKTIVPAGATNQNVGWISSNTAVATVNSSGLVTAVSVGTATIMCTSLDGGFRSTASVTVNGTITSAYSTRLTGTPNEKYGLARSLSVMPGDIITTEVFAKYLDTNTNNWNAALTNLMTAIAAGTAPAGTFIDGGAAGSIGGTTFPFIGTLPRTGDSGTGPKAYLNYIVFDRNFVYKTGGFKRLSIAPKENGSDVPHERLFFEGAEQIVITEPGYVYIYLSNENDTPVEVYFDDFKVIHTKSPVIQSDEYYPFGLAFNSYSRENSTPNLFQFNGKERQDELSLGWDDFGARMYISEIGRWAVVDPMAQERDWLSPYNFVQNNPINRVDPTGALDFVQNEQGEIYWDKNANSQATTKEGEKYLGKTLTYTFNSAIQAEQWDGPGGSAPIGDKLTSTVQVTGQENDAGELTGVTATSSVKIGETPIGTANDFYPGLGSDQNKFTLNQTKNADGTLKSFSMNFEQHASVSPIEAFGMNAMGYNIVNVAQNLKVDYSGNKVTTSAATDVFPSATLSVNGSQLFHYNQPSFKTTHGRDNRYTDNGAGGVTVEAVSRRPPPKFYQRYKK